MDSVGSDVPLGRPPEPKWRRMRRPRPATAGRIGALCPRAGWHWGGYETLGLPSVRLAPDADAPAGRPYLGRGRRGGMSLVDGDASGAGLEIRQGLEVGEDFCGVALGRVCRRSAMGASRGFE